MEAYSLSPHVLPGKPLSHDEHRRVRAALIAVIVIAVIIAVGYWLNAREKAPVAPISEEAAMRTKVVSLLSQTPTKQYTPEEVNRIVSQLSATPKKAPSAEIRAATIEEIQ